MKTKHFRSSIVVAMAWLAMTVAAAQEPLPAAVTQSIRQTYGDGEIRLFDRAVDLDGDGRHEIVVYVVGPMVCGTGGCNLLVFTPHGDGYRRVAELSVARPPIRVASTTSSGWRDLVVRIGGGGGRSGDVVLSFDGRSYPSNPTVPGPRVKAATLEGSELLIEDFQSMKEGRLLVTASETVMAPRGEPGPSFDCARAGKPAERLVCGDAELAALDRTLAAAYAKGQSKSSDWTDRDKSAERAAQRAWLAERDRCAPGPKPKVCVGMAYRQRIAALQIANGDAGPVPPAESYRCAGLEAQPVTAVYYNATEPPTAVITVGDRQVVAFVTRSGSGARYTAAGVELWEHQGEATLRWDGKTYQCRVS